ncbi:MAG: T9SS type A sorting domain-containing protein [Bacteroidota bacterium]
MKNTTILNPFLLRFSIALIGALFSQKIDAQVAVDAVTTQESTVSPVTWSHTVGNVSNRFLVVAVTTDGPSVSSITYNGTALTKADAQTSGESTVSEIWYLLNAPIGTYNVIVTLSGDDNVVCGAISFKNVNQTTPIGTVAKAAGNTATATVDVVCATATEMVVDAVSTDDNAVTVGAGQTSRWNISPAGGYASGATSTEPGAIGTVSMSWTQSSDNWAIVALPIKPSVSNCAALPTAGTASVASPIAHGATATLSIAGESAACTYQWLESTDGGTTYQIISGATTDPYTTAAKASGTYRYKAAVTNASGCVNITNVVTLTVNSGPCGSCTRYISGAGAETVVAGEIVCIKFGDTYTGTVQINGGILCVDSATASTTGGTFSGRFQSCLTFNNLDEIGCGIVDNKGTVSMAARTITMKGGIFKNSKTVTFTKLILDEDVSASTFTNRAGATLTLSDGITGLLMQGTPVSTFTNNSTGTVTLSAGGVIKSTGTFTNAGTFSINSDGFDMGAGSLTNSGSLTVTAGMVNVDAGTVTNSGTFLVSAGDFTIDGTSLSNSGTLTITNGTYTLGSGSHTNTATGTININGVGKDLIISSGSNTFTNAGDLNVADRIDMGIGGTTFANSLTVDANNWLMSTNSTLTNSTAGTITLTTSFDASQVTLIDNDGAMTTGTTYIISQGPFDNSGTITVGTNYSITQGPFTNSGTITTGQDFEMIQGGPHYNSGCVAVTRNANIGSTSITVNGPTGAGTRGRFCVGGISYGRAIFGGTGNLDMCDAGAPAGGWDDFSGTDNGTHCSGATCSSCNAVLPIELLSFDANKNGDLVKIYWATATETNNDFFTIERTVDGINYEFVGKLDGAGNSVSPLYYNTVDDNPIDGTSYYRLTQTDYDGKFVYSKLVSVNTTIKDELKLLYFFADQNKQQVQYQVSSSGNNALSIEITDVLGKIVLSEKIGFNQDQHQMLNMDVAELKNGIYLFKISNGVNNVMRKIFY